MAVQFISAESFFFLRKFFGPENEWVLVLLILSAQKHGGQDYRPREEIGE